MNSYLKLIRFGNLIFIALIQVCMLACIINPSLKVYTLEPLTSNGIAALIILASVLIAAGGYIINDYFDVKIDAINHPDDQIILKSISKRTAMRLYQIHTALGIVLGVSASVVLRNTTLGFIFIVVPGMLWFYSASYKRQFLVGNFIVAMMAAIIPLMMGIVEAGLLTREYGELLNQTYIVRTLYIWLCGFAAFSFILTLMREVVKDMEDKLGDAEMECRTLPIVLGDKGAKWVYTGLSIVVLVGLFFANQAITYPIEEHLTLRYSLIGIAAPIVLSLVLLFRSHTPREYGQISTMIKFVMAIGVLYSLIYYYLMAKSHAFPIFELFYVVQ